MNNLDIIQESWLGAGTSQHMMNDNELLLSNGDMVILIDLVDYVLVTDAIIVKCDSFATAFDYAAELLAA